MSIRDILKQVIAELTIPPYGILCTVKDIDTVAHTCTCTPINGDADIAAVRYTPGLDPNGSTEMGYGIIVVPAVNSLVMVQPSSQYSGYISMFSKCQSIQILDGSNGGVPRVVDLVTKLNQLENKLNDTNNKLATHTHAGVSVGVGVTGVSATVWATQISPITARGDIENTNVTHGIP